LFNLDKYSRYHIGVITYIKSKIPLGYYIQSFGHIRVIHLLHPLPQQYCSPTLKQDHSFPLSHPKSHSLQSIGGSLGVRWSLVIYTPSPLELVANFNLMQICYSWNLVFLDGLMFLGISKFVDNPKKFVSPALWEKLRKSLPWPLWSTKGGLLLKKTLPFVGASMRSMTPLWCGQTSGYIMCP
jgi:hypothetical protein